MITAQSKPVLDPRNQNFQWRACAGPYRMLSTEQARQYDELGYALIGGAFTAAEMAAVSAAIDPFEQDVCEPDNRIQRGAQFVAHAG